MTRLAALRTRSEPRDDVELPPLRVTAAILTIVVMPFPLVLAASHGLKRPYGYDYEAVLFPVDLGFGAVLLTAVPTLARSLRDRRAPAVRAFALAVALLGVAWFGHPSWRGAHQMLEMLGTAALAAVVVEQWGTPIGRFLSGVVGAAAVFETGVSGFQAVTGHALGLYAVGEHHDPFFTIVTPYTAPMGTTVHPYVLACLALTAAIVLVAQARQEPRRWPWLVGAAVAVAPVGYTYSRAGLLGGGLAVAVFGGWAVVSRHDRSFHWAAAITLAVGIAVPAAFGSGAWTSRASASIGHSNAGTLAQDRAHLDHEALALIGSHPVLGVGPGLYIVALRQKYHVEPEKGAAFKPVHNIVLLTMAEGGILTGLAWALLLIVVAWRAFRAAPVGLAMYLAPLPFWVLDHLTYTFPQGVVATAIWLGVIEAQARSQTAEPAVTEPVAPV